MNTSIKLTFCVLWVLPYILQQLCVHVVEKIKCFGRTKIKKKFWKKEKNRCFGRCVQSTVNWSRDKWRVLIGPAPKWRVLIGQRRRMGPSTTTSNARYSNALMDNFEVLITNIDLDWLSCPDTDKNGCKDNFFYFFF